VQAVYEAHQGALDHTRVVLGKQLGDSAVLLSLTLLVGRQVLARRAQLNLVLTFYLDLIALQSRSGTPGVITVAANTS